VTEAAVIAERAQEIADQIPTLTAVSACVDCQKLFRHGSACPYCESESVMNLAGILNADVRGGDAMR
jgi:hypothetical protein